GDLRVPLPVGFLYDPQGQVILDSDQQVQESIRFVFHSFRRVGSASAVVNAFREAALLFPHRPRGGPQDGELTWVKLRISRVLFVLHNPRYAGAFVYGRTRKRKTLEGHLERLPQDEWHTLLFGAHAGYIAWEEYEENQRRLHENAQAQGAERRRISRICRMDSRSVAIAPLSAAGADGPLDHPASHAQTPAPRLGAESPVHDHRS